MALEDRLDEALFWHDLDNDRRTQNMLDEQDAKRAAEARRHAEDIAALQGTVDELKDQLVAERKARAQAEKERADAETRFRFEMWSQTENGKKISGRQASVPRQSGKSEDATRCDRSRCERLSRTMGCSQRILAQPRILRTRQSLPTVKEAVLQRGRQTPESHPRIQCRSQQNTEKTPP